MLNESFKRDPGQPGAPNRFRPHTYGIFMGRKGGVGRALKAAIS
jgi:hypothetical protein